MKSDQIRQPTIKLVRLDSSRLMKSRIEPIGIEKKQISTVASVTDERENSKIIRLNELLSTRRIIATLPSHRKKAM